MDVCLGARWLSSRERCASPSCLVDPLRQSSGDAAAGSVWEVSRVRKVPRVFDLLSEAVIVACCRIRLGLPCPVMVAGGSCGEVFPSEAWRCVLEAPSASIARGAARSSGLEVYFLCRVGLSRRFRAGGPVQRGSRRRWWHHPRARKTLRDVSKVMAVDTSAGLFTLHGLREVSEGRGPGRGYYRRRRPVCRSDWMYPT